MLRALFTSLRRFLAGLDPVERAILALALVTHAAAIFWGLPSSDAWDNDGVAPRDVLPGLVETITPGAHYTYPPLQLALVAILSLPFSVYALVRAASFSRPDIVRAFLDVRVMTGITVVARLTSLVMSLGIVLAIGELASIMAGRTVKRARAFGMAIAAVEVALTYYAQTSNLDVPYLFWASLSLVTFARAVEDDAPNLLLRAAVLAALAVTTKDQAYALFLLSFPALAAMWAAQRGRAGARTLLTHAAWASVAAVAVVLAIDGAIYNPSGFAARVRFLLGPASQDFAQYSKDFAGRFDAFVDTWRSLPEHYPSALAPVFVAGLVLAFAARSDDRPRARIVALLPLLAALSFTLTFNCWARRVEERFVMPQMLLVGSYGGVALGRLHATLRGRGARVVFAAALGGLLAWALRLSLTIDAVMLGDPRFEAEAWLAAHARPEDTIEVYGMNVYLPRFKPWMHVVRVAPEPATRRGPMPGIEEVQDRYGDIDARKPKFVVFGEGFAWRYLIGEWSGDGGRVQPKVHKENLADHDAREHFHRLVEEKGDYKTALHARYDGTIFPNLRLHGSLGCDVWIFERR